MHRKHGPEKAQKHSQKPPPQDTSKALLYCELLAHKIGAASQISSEEEEELAKSIYAYLCIPSGISDQQISGSAVDDAPTEEPRPDASNSQLGKPTTHHRGQLACLVLLHVR
jgi:hypothetical protein